jgi:CRP/FNR family transcriptional regulator, cyclic AMP receptor protein
LDDRVLGPESAGRGDALDGIDLFAGLDRSLRHQIITAATPRRYRSGDLLYAEGEPGDSLLLLMAGAVAVFRAGGNGRQATLAAVRPPGLLGEEALAGGLSRIASARALQESFVLALRQSELSTLMRENPTMSDATRLWLGRQLGRLVEQRADDLLLDLPGRVAKTLVGFTAVDGGSIELSQAILASLARGSRQSVNQALKCFAARGWLRLESGRIDIVDLDALRRRARSD